MKETTIGGIIVNRMIQKRRIRTILFATMVMMLMAAANLMCVMSASWEGFKTSMTSFFETGLGGPGMQGVGVAIGAIGVVAAVISFVIHKFNPQSRMPGWITCLLIGLVGVMAMSGVSPFIKILTQARDLIYSWFGL